MSTEPHATRIETPTDPVIRFQGFSKRYQSFFSRPSDTWAVDKMDLEIHPGEIFALVGPNGAGKTTSLSTLVGLEAPTQGSVELLGHDSRSLPREVFAQVGWVSENQELPGWCTLKALAGFFRPLYPTWDPVLFDELVDQLGLPLGKKIKTFSKGMKMRARLLFALVYRPPVLILDEPFGGLDPSVRQDVVEGALELATGEGWTILLATHEMTLVERLADRVGYLEAGRLAFCGRIDSLLGNFARVSIRSTGSVDPDRLPTTWWGVERQGQILSLIDSAVPLHEDGQPDLAAAEASYRQTLEGVERVDILPISLEQAFIAQHRYGSSTTAAASDSSSRALANGLEEGTGVER